MNHSSDFAQFMKWLIIIGCIVLIATGVNIILEWSKVPEFARSVVSKDSTYSKNQVTDTAKKTTVTITENMVNKSSLPAPAANTQQDVMMKKGYDIVLLGLVVLFILFALPWLSEFNFLQIFSAKFKEKEDASKAIINEAANASNTNLPRQKPPTSAKSVTEEQVTRCRDMLHNPEMNIEKFSIYTEDPQKNMWGKSPIANERKLSATVIPVSGNTELFKVQLKVISTNPERPLKNKVVFHLHPTFPNSDPSIYVVQAEAKLELIAWGAFTVGAEADNGATKLELDLAELAEAPLLFKSR